MDDHDDETNVKVFDTETNRWNSFMDNDEIILERHAKGSYKLKSIGEHYGRRGCYFIVLREVKIDLVNVKKECYGINDVASLEEIEKFHEYLQERLGLSVDDIRAKCGLYIVPT